MEIRKHELDEEDTNTIFQGAYKYGNLPILCLSQELQNLEPREHLFLCVFV